MSWTELLEAFPFKSVWRVQHDGFMGSVIGHYITREGKEGVVLQQAATKVVHVYGIRWLTRV